MRRAGPREEMIRSTPARNLYDVLETYVPGLQYVVHFDASPRRAPPVPGRNKPPPHPNRSRRVDPRGFSGVALDGRIPDPSSLFITFLDKGVA